MKLAVGFITYNNDNAKYLEHFLPSLKQSLAFAKDVFILAIDNSDSGQEENYIYLQKCYPEIKCARSVKNIGFAAAYNLMIKKALAWGADYFLVVNPDTLLFPDTIQKMLTVLEIKSLAAVSPKIMQWNFPQHSTTGYLDSLGIILKPGLRFIDKGQGQREDQVNVHNYIMGPSGACGLYSLKALEKVKEQEQYFDERFFLYKEDCDLAYRLFLQGLKCQTVPESIVYHDRSLAATSSKFIKAFQGRDRKSRFGRQQSFLNQHLLYRKYWKQQNLFNKLIILQRAILMLFYVLVRERFLLKIYPKIFR